MRKYQLTKVIYLPPTGRHIVMDTNIQKFQAFVRTVDLGSFTKASEALSCSQSGISRMIGDLEKEWGVTLLERGRAGIRLTPDGERLLPMARDLCESYERLQESVNEINGIHAGTIRIASLSSVATHWLPKIVRKFAADYPDIRYELMLGDYAEIESWIAEGRVDIGFLRIPTSRNLDTTFLYRDPLMAVLPRGHPLAELDTVPIEELCKENFLLVEKSARSDAGELLKQYGPKLILTVGDDDSISVDVTEYQTPVFEPLGPVYMKAFRYEDLEVSDDTSLEVTLSPDGNTMTISARTQGFYPNMMLYSTGWVAYQCAVSDMVLTRDTAN